MAVARKETLLKLGKLAEFYYTAAEARKALGLDEDAFQYWGREGRIARVYLPGRKHPVYLKKEIDDIVDQIEATVITEQAKEIEYRKATVNDLEEENQLAQLVFGRGAAVMPRKAYLETNPDVDYHLYDYGRLVAYITIFPLKHDPLMNFMRGKIRGWEIPLEDIELFEPGKPIECLIMDMVTTPTAPPLKRAEYGRLLLSNLFKTFRQWGEQGVEITKLYAIGSTTAGQHILRTAKFQEIGKIGTGRIAFELDIKNTDARAARGYKEAFEHWKQQQTSTTPDVELVFSPSTLDDLRAEVAIGRNLYGDNDIVPLDQLLDWRDRNDKMFMSIKQNGRVVAYSSLMPLDEGIILQLVEDKIRERDIPTAAIRQWTDPQISVYVASTTVKPSKDPVRNGAIGSYLLTKTLKWALTMHQQYDIKNWYAIGATKEGQHLLESLGFTDIVSLDNGERKGYYLSDITKPTRTIRRLLEQMEQTETRNETEHELTVNLTATRAVDSDNRRSETNIRKRQARSVSVSE